MPGPSPSPTEIRQQLTTHFLHMFLHYVMMSEFVKAWNGNATMYRILNDFAVQEFEHNSTKKSEFDVDQRLLLL